MAACWLMRRDGRVSQRVAHWSQTQHPRFLTPAPHRPHRQGYNHKTWFKRYRASWPTGWHPHAARHDLEELNKLVSAGVERPDVGDCPRPIDGAHHAPVPEVVLRRRVASVCQLGGGCRCNGVLVYMRLPSIMRPHTQLPKQPSTPACSSPSPMQEAQLQHIIGAAGRNATPRACREALEDACDLQRDALSLVSLLLLQCYCCVNCCRVCAA